MGEMENLGQRRKTIRAPGIDYAQPGGYFVTICTHERRNLLGEFTDGTLNLNQVGRIVAACWSAIPDHFPHVKIDAFVVMPNHLHGIILIEEDGRGTACRAPTKNVEAFGKPVAGSIPTIVRSFKSAVSREVGRVFPHLARSLWQRNYYEHILRGEGDLNRVRQYVLTNPDNPVQ